LNLGRILKVQMKLKSSHMQLIEWTNLSGS